uniref:Uncharacterized protein n=1 Tax=Triticum urartu TaxID=4572 RepID=A0A8R7QQ09_TRIUA
MCVITYTFDIQRFNKSKHGVFIIHSNAIRLSRDLLVPETLAISYRQQRITGNFEFTDAAYSLPLDCGDTVCCDCSCSSSTVLTTAWVTATLPQPATFTRRHRSPLTAPHRLASTALHIWTSRLPHQSARTPLQRARRTSPKLSTSARLQRVARRRPPPRSRASRHLSTVTLPACSASRDRHRETDTSRAPSTRVAPHWTKDADPTPSAAASPHRVNTTAPPPPPRTTTLRRPSAERFPGLVTVTLPRLPWSVPSWMSVSTPSTTTTNMWWTATAEEDPPGLGPTSSIAIWCGLAIPFWLFWLVSYRGVKRRLVMRSID